MSSPRTIDSFVRRAASGGSEATCAATSSALAMSLACGTSHWAKPIRYASSAGSGMPSAMRIACPLPTSRASRTAPP
jgi:hypothetical protein